MDFVLRLVLGLGGWAVLTSALGVWISHLVTARLTAGWSQQNAIALEQLRADVARQQSALTSALAASSSSHAAGYERSLSAIEELWKAVVRLREATPAILIVADVLRENEYQELFTNRNIAPLRQSITMESIVTLTQTATGALEAQRPFLGEYLWAVFVAYRAFIGRSLFLMVSAKSPVTYRPWQTDAGVKDVLAAVLSKEELAPLLEMRLGRFDAVRAAIEQKMLAHVNRILSGEVSGDLGLANASRIQRAAAALQISAQEA